MSTRLVFDEEAARRIEAIVLSGDPRSRGRARKWRVSGL
jgi:hypothetical protein